jgi:hypothetical protein
MKHENLKLLITSKSYPDFIEAYDVDKVTTENKTNVILRQNGKIQYMIEDNGNNVVVGKVYPGMGLDRKQYEYHEVQELRALFQIIDRNNDEFTVTQKE